MKGGERMSDQARLTGITDSREVTSASAPQFWYTCQGAILLAMKEAGLHSEAQYRQAALRTQRPPAPEGGRT